MSLSFHNSERTPNQSPKIANESQVNIVRFNDAVTPPINITIDKPAKSLPSPIHIPKETKKIMFAESRANAHSTSMGSILRNEYCISKNAGKKINDAIEEEVPLRSLKTVIVMCLSILSLLLGVLTRLAAHQIVGIALFLMSASYLASLTITILRAPAIWRVVSITKRIKGWLPMPVVYAVKQFPNRSIISISEMAAIHGARINKSLATVCDVTCTTTVIMVLVEITTGNMRILANYDTYFALVGAFGLQTLGNWDLNPFSKHHGVMHYIGVVMGAMSFVAFCGLNYRRAAAAHGDGYGGFAISIVILLSAIIALVVFLRKSVAAKQYTGEDRDVVHRNSLWCLFSEMLSVLLMISALCWWIYLID